MRFAWAVTTAVVMLSLLGQASYGGCWNYTDCTSCASDGNCMWALLYDCTERCIDQNYENPNVIKNKGAIWRSVVRNKTQCPNKELCVIMEGDVPNPSFDDWSWKEFSEKVGGKSLSDDGKPIVTGSTKHFPWVFSRTISVRNHTSASSTYENDLFNSVDGEFFLVMGSSGKRNAYEVRLDGFLKISEGATHLSFFYALPYYSKHFSQNYEFINRTALDVYIDNEHLLHLCKGNINDTMYRESDALYHPMNIDISRFADGKNHSLMLYFTKGSDYIYEGDSRTPGQMMFIDYVQIIKSNRKHISSFFFPSIFFFDFSKWKHVRWMGGGSF